MESFDLSPLEMPLTAADRRAYRQQLKTVKKHSHEWIIQLIAVFACFFIGVGLLANAVNPPAGQEGYMRYVTFPIGAILVLFGIGTIEMMVARRSDNIRLLKFARANNCRVDFDIEPQNEAGLLFSRGHARRVVSRLTLPNGTQIANYRYVVGYERSRKVHDWCYVRVPLPRAVPNMVLDSKKNNGLWLANLNVAFNADQKLSLEGNFDEYFTLYTPRKYEKDALYIFTPDVMQILIERGTDFDMETVDHSLYMYRFGRFSLGNAELYKRLLPILSTISKKVLNQADFYSDEKIDDWNKDVVTQSGARLKKHRFSIVVALAAVIYLIYLVFAITKSM